MSPRRAVTRGRRAGAQRARRRRRRSRPRSRRDHGPRCALASRPRPDGTSSSVRKRRRGARDGRRAMPPRRRRLREGSSASHTSWASASKKVSNHSDMETVPFGNGARLPESGRAPWDCDHGNAIGWSPRRPRVEPTYPARIRQTRAHDGTVVDRARGQGRGRHRRGAHALDRPAHRGRAGAGRVRRRAHRHRAATRALPRRREGGRLARHRLGRRRGPRARAASAPGRQRRVRPRCGRRAGATASSTSSGASTSS